MKILELIILIFFTAVFVFEGIQSVKKFIGYKASLKETLEKRLGCVIQKDYKIFLVGYAVVGLFLFFYSVYYFSVNQVIYALIMLLFALFSITFALDTIVQRTTVFYDTGLFYNLEHKKYRSILKIGDKHSFWKGYTVRLTNNEEIYVSKKGRVILEEKLARYKERKKER